MSESAEQRIILFSRKMAGWVLKMDPLECGYDVTQALEFPADYTFDREDFASHEVSHKNNVFGDFTLLVVFDEFRIGHRSEYCFPVIERVNKGGFDITSFDHDDHALVTTEKRWAWRFDRGHDWKLADNEAAAFAAARLSAIRSMTNNGHHYCNLYRAYKEALEVSGCYKDDHRIKDHNENAMFNIEKPKYVIGDQYTYRREDGKKYARDKLLRSLITYYRFKFSSSLRGYGQSCEKTRGPLIDFHKQKIRDALAVFDNAYQVEVVGAKPESAYTNCATNRASLGGVACASSGFRNEYYLLFRAVVNGREQVLVPEIPTGF